MALDRPKGAGVRAVMVVTLFVLIAGCGSGDAEPGREAAALVTVAPEQAADMTIAEVLRTDERFSRFRMIAERVETPVAASWLDVWDWDASRMGDNRDGVTVFAPTDAAFESLDAAILAVLDDSDIDNAWLYSLMGHHYVHRLYPSEEFELGPQATWRRSASGPVELTVDPLTWGGQPIEQTDLRAANGYIHVLDGVVIPDDVAAAADG